MKKTVTSFICVLLLVFCSVLTSCDMDNESGTLYAPNGLEYKINDDGQTCTIVGIGKCIDTVVEIPHTIKEYKVTVIGKEAFCPFARQGSEICSDITGFVLPSSLTTICDSAFLGCSSLTSIDIPNSVTTIEDKAFQECTKLAEITLSPSLTSIPIQMCAGCTSLESIVIPDNVKMIGGAAFLQSGLTQVTLGEKIEEIGESSFYSDSSIPTFYYSGTIEQWKNITVGGMLVSDFEKSTLKCSDLEISLQKLYYENQ